MTAERPAVLFIAPQPFFQARGTPIRVRFDVQALAELGFRVDLLTLPLGEEIAIPGVRILRTANPFGLRDLAIGPSFWKVVYDLLLLWHAWRLASLTAYRIVHCVEDAGLIGLALRWRFGCRLVFEKHSDPASYRGGRLRNLLMALYQKVETRIIRAADAVITGPALMELARSFADHDRFYTICSLPSTVRTADPERSLAIRRGLARSDREVLLMYIGSFATYQGIELMFEAIALVVRERPEARFVIIGGSGAEVARWRSWLVSRQAADAVRFIERIDTDDVPDYLAAADVLLSPRLAGANPPLKHVDYLKANRAVVAIDTIPNRFYLDPSVAVVTGTTARAFADGILRLISDPALRNRLAGNDRPRIDDTYSYPELKQRLAACYADLGRRDAGASGVVATTDA
jgi:glycosyltransferase involved in cell wall biosynthesis